MKKVKILMCGSKLNVKGGMVSVIKNYLSYNEWENIEIKYVPTHIEGKKVVVALFFAISFVKVIFTAIFGHYDLIYLHTAERGSFYRKSILVRFF